MKRHKRRLPTGFGLHPQELRQSVALRGEADFLKAFFGARRRHFARDHALRGKALDLTIAGNWSYEMEPVLPTMSHRNFRHFSIERGRFCNGRPP
jgi:hypothetical protein